VSKFQKDIEEQFAASQRRSTERRLEPKPKKGWMFYGQLFIVLVVILGLIALVIIAAAVPNR